MWSTEVALPDQDATRALGVALAAGLAAGDVLLLEGGLGAGKTTLVQALAHALGVAESEVHSPTFALLSCHALPGGEQTLAHADLYRLRDASELHALGLMELVGADDVLCCVEWPALLAPLLTGVPTFRLRLEHAGAGRRATLEGPRPLLL